MFDFTEYNKQRVKDPNYVNPMKGKKRPDLVAYNKRRKDNPNYISPMQGRHHTEETKLKISKANRGQQRLKGKDHPNWKGGRAERVRLRNIRYRKRRGWISTKIIQLVYEDNIKQYGTLTCIYCKQSIEFGKDTLEHKIPLIRGGTSEYSNLGVACGRCNSKKRHKTEEEYCGSSPRTT